MQLSPDFIERWNQWTSRHPVRDRLTQVQYRRLEFQRFLHAREDLSNRLEPINGPLLPPRIALFRDP